MSLGIPLTDADKAKFNTLNKDTVEYLMTRYNKVNRWVIADMIRRSAYHYPDKTAMIFGDRKMTYAEMEGECNRVANALIDLGVRKYDRVAILAHNTIDHVLTWFGCCKAGAVYLAINYLLRARTSPTASTTPRASSSSWRTLSTIWSRTSSARCPR